MNELFFKRPAISGILILTTLGNLSCVNEEYDLSQGIDMDMTLLQNAAVPLGSVAPISISTLLGDSESGSSVYSFDENGNIYLSFARDTLTRHFTMPEVEIGGDEGVRFDDNVEVIFVPKYNGNNLAGTFIPDNLSEIPSSLPSELYFSNSVTGGLQRAIELTLNKELPKQILDIKSVNTNAKILYNFEVSDGAVLYLKAGFTIHFPRFMVLKDIQNCDYYKINEDEYGPHVLEFTKDIKISDKEPLTIEIGFVRLNIPAGAIVTSDTDTNEEIRSVDISCTNPAIADAADKPKVDVSGDMYLKLADYAGRFIPDAPTLTMDIELDNLRMISADVKIDVDINVDDKNVEIGDLPDILSAKGTVMDLYNPMFRFLLHNESPVDIYLNADITTFHSSGNQCDIHIGNCTKINNESHEHATEDVVVEAKSDAEYYFSRRGKHDSKGGTDIKLDGLGDMIKTIPENIAIHDVSVEAERNFINIKANEKCKVYMDYEFICPLSFGKDLNISFNYDIDLGLNGETMGLDSLLISMDMINTIPLDFAITGVALDAKGDEIKGASVNLDLKLAAGTMEAPSNSPVDVVLSTSGVAKASKLRLKMAATSSRQMEGKTLNTAQGLGINNLHISLPRGITLDLTNDGNN